MVNRGFDERDGAPVIDLWLDADLLRPWNDPDGDDGHREWTDFHAVDANVRRAGVGRLLMTLRTRRCDAAR